MTLKFENVFIETTYPSGEWHIEAIGPLPFKNETIVANITDFNGLMKCIIGDQILRDNEMACNWVVPFFPFARDDRRTSRFSGEELVFALNMAEKLGCAVVDPHSDVVGSRLRYFPQSEVVVEYEAEGLFKGNPIIAIPDAGAAKKAYSWIDKYGLESVQCLKRRDPATGKLSGFKVVLDGHRNLDGRPVVIVDDICDGGGTFIGLASELKDCGAGELRLAVTHGLFTKGLMPLLIDFSKVYTLDMCDLTGHSRLIKAKLTNIIERGNFI